MKPARSQDPTPWRDGDADTHALESRAALLADAASQFQPLTPAALSRIQEEVVARREASGFRTIRQGRMRMRLAFAIGLLLLCAATAGGAGVLWRKYVSSERKAAPRAAADTNAGRGPRRPVRVAARTPEVEAPPPAIEPPAAEPPAAVEAVAPLPARPADPPAREPTRLAPSSPKAAPAAPPSKVTETALIAEALFDLRQLHDAREALSTLDRYQREFPHGVLETEALRTRIEAVVQLGDLKTALSLLDGKSARGDALGDDLLLTRAELRAAAGRFEEAVADFTQVLDGAASALVIDGDERALYGRAVCLGRLAQYERARADLVAYQTRFPQGRFAVEVQRLLAAEQPSPSPP